jgi:NAD(P)-dependent dehydrogenase (short-subunit alcohol dehydrogenase family)
MAAYVASKSALNAYIEVLANELRPRRITANAIAPSALATPAMLQTMAPELLVPLERVGETIAFLLSDSAASITGQVLELTA